MSIQPLFPSAPAAAPAAGDAASGEGTGAGFGELLSGLLDDAAPSTLGEDAGAPSGDVVDSLADLIGGVEDDGLLPAPAQDAGGASAGEEDLLDPLLVDPVLAAVVAALRADTVSESIADQEVRAVTQGPAASDAEAATEGVRLALAEDVAAAAPERSSDEAVPSADAGTDPATNPAEAFESTARTDGSGRAPGAEPVRVAAAGNAAERGTGTPEVAPATQAAPAAQANPATATTAPPNAAAGTAERAPGGIPAPAHQVIERISNLVQRDGTSRITIKLQPESLGEVRVVVSVRDGVVQVRLAGGDAAAQALAQEAPELRRLLEQVGATDTRVQVRDGSGNATYSSHPDQQHDEPQRHHAPAHTPDQINPNRDEAALPRHDRPVGSGRASGLDLTM